MFSHKKVILEKKRAQKFQAGTQHICVWAEKKKSNFHPTFVHNTIHLCLTTSVIRAPDKVRIFIPKMPISWLNPMFDLSLESSHRDDSNKRSNIGFGQEIMELASIKVNFTNIIWSSAQFSVYKSRLYAYMLCYKNQHRILIHEVPSQLLLGKSLTLIIKFLSSKNDTFRISEYKHYSGAKALFSQCFQKLYSHE